MVYRPDIRFRIPYCNGLWRQHDLKHQSTILVNVTLFSLYLTLTFSIAHTIYTDIGIELCVVSLNFQQIQCDLLYRSDNDGMQLNRCENTCFQTLWTKKSSTHFGQAISRPIHLMCINLNGLSLVKCAKFERVGEKTRSSNEEYTKNLLMKIYLWTFTMRFIWIHTRLDWIERNRMTFLRRNKKKRTTKKSRYNV